ncbi:hypothetical protein QEO94_11325 [Kingella negevensis]|uniref:hypothetical protein n=1 Tax=Kingella negevensis TaxID=1522312 RepID=UPI0025432BE1|nr:hypothetical protein [Kingella negevensis]WII93190.1 hypothetical protein QEO94_11325 [Kingella negevensis]
MAFIGALFFFILLCGLINDFFWGIGHTIRLCYKFADFTTSPKSFGKMLTYALLVVGGFILRVLFIRGQAIQAA